MGGVYNIYTCMITEEMRTLDYVGNLLVSIKRDHGKVKIFKFYEAYTC